jgi:hypothetical protein
MPKCPYCKNELAIEDFFITEQKETKKGKIKTRVKGFNGQELSMGINRAKMWVCPSCDSILGFTEYRQIS